MADGEPTADSAWAVEESRAEGGRLLIYERLLPALAVSVALIRNELGTALERERVTTDRRADIALFVSEASTNVVVHAYVGTRPGPLYASASLAERDIIVSVCDGGRGMVAHPDSPGLGLGVPLMLRLSDGLYVSSEAGGQGTCVHATFDRAIGSPTPAAREPTGHDDRGAMLREYLRVLEADHVALREDTEAVRAQASHVVARARRQRRERAEQRNRP